MKRANWGRQLAALPWVVMFPNKPIAYLDTNAISDLSRSRPPVGNIAGFGEVRAQLCSFASKRVVASGQWAFSELAFMEAGRKRQDFEADLDFFCQQIHSPRIFRHNGELRTLDGAAAMSATRADPLIQTDLPIDWRSFGADLWREERDLLTRDKLAFAAYEAKSRQRVDASYPDRKDRAERLRADWDADREGIIARWVRGRMKDERAPLGLPHEQLHWPSPQAMRTTWCCWSYLIARSVLIEEGKHEDCGSDFVDWCHFQNASHADEFVTSDRDFLRIVAEAPPPKPECLLLADWIERLRSEP